MSSSLFLFRKVETMDKDKELKKESKKTAPKTEPEKEPEKELEKVPEKVPEMEPENAPKTTPEVKLQDENLEVTQKETQDEKAPEINIPGATKLDIDFELANVVFFKVNKPLGDAAYNLIESRVDAINQKYSDKITIILVPFSVNVEQE